MPRPGQGESLVAWAFLGAVTVAVLVTYSRLDAAELYNVSREGLAGGLGRAVVLLNFPIALVAIALTLAAVTVLPRIAWLVAGPAIALLAGVAVTVDQNNLDVRWVNALPALGVVLALLLTVAAARVAGTSFASHRPGDRARIILAGVILVLSLPWVTADFGFHFPGDLFLGEEPYAEDDGRSLAAVHLGHHHGGDGALLLLVGLLLSRMQVSARPLRIVFTTYLGAMLAYGAVNLAQDLWHEQVVKRGWSDTDIPSALVPGPHPIWVVVVVLSALATLLLRREGDRAAPVPAGA